MNVKRMQKLKFEYYTYSDWGNIGTRYFVRAWVEIVFPRRGQLYIHIVSIWRVCSMKYPIKRPSRESSSHNNSAFSYDGMIDITFQIIPPIRI